MAPKPEKPTLSLLGKLGLVPIAIALIAQAIFVTLTGVLVRKEDRPPNYHKYVLFGIIRTFFSLTSSAQEHWLCQTTGAEYRQFCKRRKLVERTELLSDNTTQVHWLGDVDAEHILIHFHGGGYNLPATAWHFAFLHELVAHFQGMGNSFAIVILEYDLAPYGTYPRQLAQAALALNDLLKSRPVSTILIGGDSAGGHLVAGLLLHILRRHPDQSVPEVKLARGQKLKAAFLISPWIEHSSRAESYQRNARKDICAVASLRQHANLFRNGSARDEYLEPLTAPKEHWKRLGDIVNSMYICGASDEILVDDIIRFQDIVRTEWVGPVENFQYVEVAGEPHVGCVTDRAFFTKDIKSAAVVRGWLEKALS